MDAFRSALTQYGDFHAMLSDPVRMTAFDHAIRQKVKPGDVVVDLGAGTGILGFLAIRAGADKVFCIEKSDAIELARAVAAKNGMTDRMVFLEANSKEVSLPVKADVIVSETLGSFGVDENTLEFTAIGGERQHRDFLSIPLLPTREGESGIRGGGKKRPLPLRQRPETQEMLRPVTHACGEPCRYFAFWTSTPVLSPRRSLSQAPQF